MKTFLRKTLVGAAVATALASTACAQIRLYSVIDLGAYGTDPHSFHLSAASGINNHGDVVGVVAFGAESMMARFSRGTVTAYGSTDTWPTSSGEAINNRGTLVGWMEASAGSSIHAFIVDAAGVRTDFGAGVPGVHSLSRINDWDEFIGRGFRSSILGHPSGWVRDLSVEVGPDFEAVDINNGWELAGHGRFGPMIYNHLLRSSTYLASVLGAGARVAAINDDVEVAGWVGGRGFVYRSGSVVYFGTDVGWIADMNNAGDVVGVQGTDGFFVFLKSRATVIDLNAALDIASRNWILTEISGINDHGVICGTAMHPPRADAPNGVHHAVKLIPYDLPLIISPL